MFLLTALCVFHSKKKRYRYDNNQRCEYERRATPIALLRNVGIQRETERAGETSNQRHQRNCVVRLRPLRAHQEGEARVIECTGYTRANA